MSHTSGPWLVEGESSNDGEAEVIVAENRTICWTANTWDVDGDEEVITEEDRANARLIAAAPEMLAALASIRSSLMELDDDGCGRPGCGWREMDATYVDQLISNNLRLAIDAIAIAEGRE
jgi:antitoxin (DNA-binding transcriptional repressor) of toxin-antitoxin stability system